MHTIDDLIKVNFLECTEARYDEMLGILPPVDLTSKGSLVGEPNSHRICSMQGNIAADFSAFVTIDGKFFEASRCLTRREFSCMTRADIVARLQFATAQNPPLPSRQ